MATSAPRTPLRALQSSLAGSASSSLPSSAGYEAHVKALLRDRTQRIFVRCIFLCLIFQTCCSWSFGPNTISSLFMSSIMLLVGAVVPILILRKSHLKTERQVSPTPAQTFSAAMSSPHRARTLQTLFAFFLSSLVTLYSHTLLSPSTRIVQLTLFVTSKKHPLYLNSHIIYLALLQLCLSIIFTIQIISMDRYVFPLHRHRYGPKSYIFAIFNSFGLFLICTPLTLFLFGSIRIFVLPILFKIPLLGTLMKPFAAHFLRRASGYTLLLPITHFPLIMRGAWLTVATSWLWEVSAFGVFDDIISAPIKGGTVEMLIGALSSKSSSGIEHHFALVELSEAAKEENSARREVMFNSPPLWSHLLRQSLLMLGTDYQHLLRRGAPPPPPPPPAPTAAQPTPIPATPTTPFKPLQSNIYKSPTSVRRKSSPIHSLLNTIFNDEGDVNRAVDEVAETVHEHVPEALRASVASALPPPIPVPAAPEQIQRASRLAVDFSNRIPAWAEVVRRWWNKERVVKKVESGVLKFRERDVLIASLLSHLTSRSLTEDKFGTIQRDIPKIVEALLSFLSALEAFTLELQTEMEKVPEEERGDVQRASEVVLSLASEVKSSMGLIVRTFGNKLGAFRWPIGVGDKVEEWVIAVGGV